MFSVRTHIEYPTRLLVLGCLILLSGCNMKKGGSDYSNNFPQNPPYPVEQNVATEPIPTQSKSDGWSQTSVAAYQNTVAQIKPAQWSQLPPLNKEDMQFFWPAFMRNCSNSQQRFSANADPNNTRLANPQHWQSVCQKAQSIQPQDASAQLAFLQNQLSPWMLTVNNTQVRNTVTGYYEPIVTASRTRQGEFQWPLYAKPTDLQTVATTTFPPDAKGNRILRGRLVNGVMQPYPTRAEIQANDSNLKAIVWVNDPIDAFFLQVQGSGRAYLVGGEDNGRVIRLAYADQNGHPYYSIGQWLIDQKELPANQANTDHIKQWLAKNPDRVQELLNVNPSIVFFKEEVINNEPGPKGALGVPLTPQHSVAVDTNWIALGTPLLLRTNLPGQNSSTLQRLVIAQDTGSAIKGPGRIDFYWGTGAAAGEIAGRMKQWGVIWLLWPKGFKPPKA